MRLKHIMKTSVAFLTTNKSEVLKHPQRHTLKHRSASPGILYMLSILAILELQVRHPVSSLSFCLSILFTSELSVNTQRLYSIVKAHVTLLIMAGHYKYVLYVFSSLCSLGNENPSYGAIQIKRDK